MEAFLVDIVRVHFDSPNSREPRSFACSLNICAHYAKHLIVS